MKKTQKTRITRKIPETLIDCEVEGRILGMREEPYKEKQVTIITVGVDLGKGVLLKVDSTVFDGSPGWRTIKDMLLPKGKARKLKTDRPPVQIWDAIGYTLGVTLHVSDSKSRTPFCRIVSFVRPAKTEPGIEELYERIAYLETQVAEGGKRKPNTEKDAEDDDIRRRLDYEHNCLVRLKHVLGYLGFSFDGNMMANRYILRTPVDIGPSATSIPDVVDEAGVLPANPAPSELDGGSHDVPPFVTASALTKTLLGKR